jgi:hypothetical protein
MKAIKRKKTKKIDAVYRVLIIESELGWGQRIDSHKDFDDPDEANRFVKKYNAENKKTKVVPDIYWYAEQPKLVDRNWEK